MKRLLSLFDYSGNWSQPYYNGNWDVINWDIKIADFMDIMRLDSVETVLDLFEDIDGILAAVPCTDFAVSGAQYWPSKDNDGRTIKSMELVHQVQRLADLFEPTDPEYEEEFGPFFWAMENPVGRIPKLFPELGKPFYFNPCDYALWQTITDSQHNELDRIRRKDGVNVTFDEVMFVMEMGAYTKKTGLWGSFNIPEKKPIEPVRVCKQGSPVQFFGGKSDRTKELRSNTPIGFSIAFYNANN